MTTERLSTRAVAGRLFDAGYTADTLPREEPMLAGLIARAFEGHRLAALPATRSDFRDIRAHLEMMVRAEERAA